MKSEKINWLDCESKIGDIVSWYTITKQVKTGTLIKMDSHFMATIKLDDGTLIEYQC